MRSSRHLDKGGGVPPNFFRPFGLRFGLKIREGPAPRAPPLDPPLMWTGISSPSSLRGGSALWTIFFEIKIKKIPNIFFDKFLREVGVFCGQFLLK